MAKGLSTIEQLVALQASAREVLPELGTVAEVNRGILTDMLTNEGYDLKNNSLEAATRAWQLRNGLSITGLDSTGGPDVVTLALIAAKFDERLPKGATTEQLREFALANLTEIASDRSNGSKMDAVFENAGLGAALAATAAAPSATAAAPVAATPELDAMGNPIIKAEAGAPAAHDHAHDHGHEHDHAAHAGDPLGDFIKDRGFDRAGPTSGPDLGTRVGEGVEAARAAGGKLASDVADGAGRVWDNVTGAFKKLGEKAEPAAEDPVAKAEAARLQAEREAEAKAKLQAAADAISKRANEMRRGAGEMATSAMDNLGEGLKGLGDRLKKLGSDEPAAPAADAASAAQPVRPAAKVQPKF